MKQINRVYVKNYKELCTLLDITCKTNTDSKKRQIDEQKQYYIITRKGIGFFVQSRKEFKVIKLKDNTRTGKYNINMNKLLMNYVLESNVAHSKHILLLELFKHLKFVGSTTPGIYDCTESITEKYSKWIFVQARSRIDAKIYDLLNNSLESLRRSNNIIVDYYYELKGDVIVEDSDDIIKNLTDNMLIERKIKSEFFLRRKSEKEQKDFYSERNTILRKSYGFEVKGKVTDITIINQGNYKRLNTVQYKKCCTEVFNLMRNDLMSKIDKGIELTIDSIDDSTKQLIEMFGEDIIKKENKTINDSKLLEELYNEYIVYFAD